MRDGVSTTERLYLGSSLRRQRERGMVKDPKEEEKRKEVHTLHKEESSGRK